MGSDVDALFEVPLGEFTSARNALVARLKKALCPVRPLPADSPTR
jgi:hypothetical protein